MSIVVVNPFEVPKGKEEQALAMWEMFADYFRRQPGYLGTKLHRAVHPDTKFYLINVAEWESEQSFLQALADPELTAIAEQADQEIMHYPGIYDIIRT